MVAMDSLHRSPDQPRDDDGAKRPPPPAGRCARTACRARDALVQHIEVIVILLSVLCVALLLSF
jgi:hypothetical protein